MKKHFVRLQMLLVLVWMSGGCGLLLPSHHNTLDYKPIHAAAQAGDLATVKTLVQKDHRLVEAQDWDDLTPLHLAVLHKHLEVVTLLLNEGARVNARTTAGVTPLHFAAQTGNLPMVELLLAHKANLRAIDSKGWTPLDRAEKWRHPDVANYLRQHGGDYKPTHFPGPKWMQD